MKTIFLLIAWSLVLISCNNKSDSLKEKELELKERELEIREKELEQKETAKITQENKKETTSKKSKTGERKLRFLFSANGGLKGFYSDGSVAGCPRCDLNEQNISTLNASKPFSTYNAFDDYLMVGNERMDFYVDGKVSYDWAMWDYKWYRKPR